MRLALIITARMRQNLEFDIQLAHTGMMISCSQNNWPLKIFQIFNQADCIGSIWFLPKHDEAETPMILVHIHWTWCLQHPGWNTLTTECPDCKIWVQREEFLDYNYTTLHSLTLGFSVWSWTQDQVLHWHPLQHVLPPSFLGKASDSPLSK